jgi:CreA protein
MMNKLILACVLLALPVGQAYANDSREIGAVSTAFKLIGPNHKIVVSAFDDPKIKGITCYVARPRTGGIKGGLGLAEDPSLASVSCVQTGPVTYSKPVSKDDDGEQVFDESRSIIFKTLDVKRLVDAEKGVLVYVVRTSRIIEGSPDTSVSVVAPMTWDGVKPEAIKFK